MSDNTDEIDLIELCKNIFSFTFKNKWIIIGAFLVGAILGFFKAKESAKKDKDYYRSQFIVESPFISGNEIYMIARNLSYNLDEINSKEGVTASIIRIDCLKDVVEGKEPEVNMIFETSKEVNIEELTSFAKEQIKRSENYKMNYNTASQHDKELMKLINQQLSLFDVKKEQQENEQFLNYLKILEKKQDLEKKMVSLEKPIQTYPIAPLNKLESTRKSTVMLTLGYGIIISCLSILLVLLVRFFKLLRA